MRRILFWVLIALSVSAGKAQFRALQTLPWYPVSDTREIIGQDAQSSASSNILDQIVETFNAGDYEQVATVLYPEAVKQGYQRNATLYNNTRRALRQMMRNDVTDDSWKRMQSLYQDRFRHLGRDEYDYRNNLELTSWSEQQLQNEQIIALASQVDRYEDAYKAALDFVNERNGQVDLAVVIHGMFAPVNRAHVAHPEIGADITEYYQQVLRSMDATSDYMEKSHRKELLAYYPTATLEQVRNECLRVIGINQAAEQHVLQQQQKAMASDYADVLSLYRQKNYARAYTACNEALSKNNSAELHVLKSNILQSAGNQATSTADRVAFWCASYEAGRGYVNSTTLNHLLDAIHQNLFMSGVAGQTHKTGSVMVITQKVWTLDQLREKIQ